VPIQSDMTKLERIVAWRATYPDEVAFELSFGLASDQPISGKAVKTPQQTYPCAQFDCSVDKFSFCRRLLDNAAYPSIGIRGGLYGCGKTLYFEI
jgi:hypothetical protein